MPVPPLNDGGSDGGSAASRGSRASAARSLAASLASRAASFASGMAPAAAACDPITAASAPPPPPPPGDTAEPGAAAWVEGEAPAAGLRWWQWAAIASVDLLGPFSTDAYVPLLPAVKDDLHASTAAVGLSLQLNWVMKGVANLALGLLADRYGRRPVLMLSLLVFCAATVAGSFSQTAVELVASRLVQGFGEGSAVLVTTVCRDVIPDEAARARAMSLLLTLKPLAVISAPAVGGAVGSWLGWRGLFRCQAAWGGATLLLVAAGLPETRPPAARGGGGGGGAPLLRSARRFATSGVWLGVNGLLAGTMGSVLALISTQSFIYEGYYGFHTAAAGALMGAPIFTGIAGAVVAAKLVKLKAYSGACFVNWTNFVLLLLAAYQAVAGLPKPLPSYIYQHGWWTFTASVCVLACVTFMQGGPARSAMMQPFGDAAGLCAGASGLVVTFVSTGVSAAATAAYDDTPRHTFLIMAAATAAGVLWYTAFVGGRACCGAGGGEGAAGLLDADNENCSDPPCESPPPGAAEP